MKEHFNHFGRAMPQHDLRKLALQASFLIKEKLPNAEVVVVRGMSGVTVGTVVAMLTGLPLAIVRKRGYDCHNDHPVIGCYEFSRYVILDDFVDTGNTVNQIVGSINKDHEEEGIALPECLGVVQYLRTYKELCEHVYSDNKNGALNVWSSENYREHDNDFVKLHESLQLFIKPPTYNPNVRIPFPF